MSVVSQAAAVDRFRHDTRGCASVTHLNNCGAALQTAEVVDAMVDHLRLEEQLGGYEAGGRASLAAERLYAAAGELLGCASTDIAFADSGSRAWNTLIYAVPRGSFQRVLVSPIDSGGALAAVYDAANRVGATVEKIAADDHGRVDLSALERSLADGPPALVAMTHAAAHSGSVNPIAEVGTLTRRSGALCLVDACQSVGQMRVTVETLGCDALVTSGRKWLRGPRGTALLYAGPAVTGLVGPLGADVVNSSLTLDRNRVGTVRFRSDGRRFELWERSIANAIGLGHALGYADRTIRSHPWVLDRITDLAQHAADGLRSIVGVDVWAPPVVESGIVGFVVDGHDPTEVVARCAEEGINISMQVAAAVPFDFARRGRIASCRVAPHYFNEHAEVDRFLAVVRSLG